MSDHLIVLSKSSHSSVDRLIERSAIGAKTGATEKGELGDSFRESEDPRQRELHSETQVQNVNALCPQSIKVTCR